MSDIVERLEAQVNRMTTSGEVEEAAIDEIERNRAAIAELAKYFTSGNSIPVDQATIKATDFWRITGLDATKHQQPTTTTKE